MYLVIRSTTEPLALAPAVRAAIARLDPAQPDAEIRSLGDTVRSSVADRRLHAFVASAFAALALVVALVGLVATVTGASRTGAASWPSVRPSGQRARASSGW